VGLLASENPQTSPFPEWQDGDEELIPVMLGQMRRAVWYKEAYEIVNDAYVETGDLLTEALNGWDKAITTNDNLLAEIDRQQRFYRWFIPIGVGLSVGLGFFIGVQL
jgi:hypothetical protein